MIKKMLSVFLVFISVFAITSCNDSSVGVFYGLSQEEKVKDYSLPNRCTSEDMIKTGGYLYVAAGSIYKKLAEGGELDWHKVSSPEGYHYVSQMGLFKSDIYIVSFAFGDADTYLFKGDGSGTWTKVSTPIDKTISRMRIVNDVIFLSDKSGNLYHSTDGSSFTQDTSLPKLFVTSSGSYDVVFDGSKYYLNTLYKLYRGTYNSWTEFTPKKSSGKEWKDDDEVFTRLYFDNGDTRLYAADSAGNVYAVDSPSSADEKAWIMSDDNTPSSLGILGLVVLRIPTSAGGIHKVLLCGSGINGGKGYYEVHNPDTSDREKLDPQRPKNAVSIISDYYDYVSFDLSQAAINSFFVDTYPDGSFDFYALTYGYGIWKNSDKGGYRRAWNQE